MLRHSIFVFFALSGPVLGASAERSISVGEDCDSIVEVERSLGSTDVLIQPEIPMVSAEATYRGYPAQVIYRCSKENWSQLIIFGVFEEEQAVRQYEILKDEISEKLGNVGFNPHRETLWKRFVLLISTPFLDDVNKSLKLYGTRWLTNELDISAYARPNDYSGESSENYWRVAYSIEGVD